MILTGAEIGRERARGAITIDPYRPEQVNPNSYNFRLGRHLKVYLDDVLDPRHPNRYQEIEIPEEGLLLQPSRLYLAHTEEVLGSDTYVPTFAARSSVARLGLFINLSACLGDIGYVGQWTLQLYALHPIKVYPGMCIGQMMWWTPQGTVRLYAGKYQGSVGARPSDIHLDFDRQIARHRLPSLDTDTNADAVEAQVGGKFATLARLSRDFPIPPAFAIPVGEFAAALHTDQQQTLRQAFADMRGTVGAFAEQTCREIAAALDTLAPPPELAQAVAARLGDLHAAGAAAFAVRSSAVGEDGAQSSFAGVHRSVLNLTDAHDVLDAVISCWQSYYHPAAVLARVRTGDFSPDPRMALFVQAMVSPSHAGVAFTRPNVVDIEYVHGTGDALMAGVTAPTRASVDLTHPDQPPADLHRRVAQLAARTRSLLGTDVDVEWALDDRELWLLQCRPVTAALHTARRDTAPIARTEPLYPEADQSEDNTVELGAVAEVVAGYRRKRGPAYNTAQNLGISVLPGLVVHVNRRALDIPRLAAALERALRQGPASRLVLDLGVGQRQQIIDKPDLIQHLRDGLPGDDTFMHTLVVRDFVTGQTGLIASITDGELLLETSTDGLMAINRGHATTQRSIAATRSPDPSRGWVACPAPVARPFTAEQAVVVGDLTAALDQRHGRVTTEWVIDDGILYFIDYSVLGAPTAAAGVAVMSRGSAHGPVLTLDIPDAELERLSLSAAVSVTAATNDEWEWAVKLTQQVTGLAAKPIIVARRPYAALSVLIDHVAGFLFQDGAVLCHLAILLREAGVPAIIHSDPPEDGFVTLTEHGVTFHADSDPP